MNISRILPAFVFLAVLVISCGKPNDPEDLSHLEVSDGGYKIVSKYETPTSAQDLLIKDNMLYIAQGEGGLLILDRTDPANLQQVSITTQGVRGYSAKIDILDTVVYLAAGSFGLSVLDVSDPFAPEVSASNLSLKPARNIMIMGEYLFAAESEQGVGIANIVYPTQPDIRGGITTQGYANAMAHTADSNYIAVATGEMGFSMYNITNFQNGYGQYPLAGWCDTPGSAEDIVLKDDEKIAFLACGTGGLNIVDYADTSNVHIIGSLDEGGYAKELIYEDGMVYMTAELSGLQVIDVSDFSAPFLVGQVDTEFALGITKDDDYIYIADEDEGIIVISIPE